MPDRNCQHLFFSTLIDHHTMSDPYEDQLEQTRVLMEEERLYREQKARDERAEQDSGLINIYDL